MEYNILVINPGSTSTKIAYYRKGEQLLLTNVEHSPDCLAMQNSKKEQIDFRQTEILQVLNEAGIDLKELDGVASRGGTFGKMHSGAYLVDEELVHASMSPDASHASNLGAVIAFDIAKMYGVKAYIYDAVSADETQEIAHYTGLKGVYRKNRTHVLNTKAICRRTAEECGCRYEDMNFIAVHIGGGISVNAHKKGDIIDSVSGDDGPMSVQRAGGFSTLTLIELCFCGKYTREQLEKIVMTEGGIVSHFGTYDVKSVEEKAGNGDGYAKTIMEVWAYQISKAVGEMAAVLRGDVDYIVISGGAAYSGVLTDMISSRVRFIAPIRVIPGSLEMPALANGVAKVLSGEEDARRYKREEKYFDRR